jgi:hypothetical protein
MCVVRWDYNQRNLDYAVRRPKCRASMPVIGDAVNSSSKFFRQTQTNTLAAWCSRLLDVDSPPANQGILHILGHNPNTYYATQLQPALIAYSPEP